MCKNIHDFKIRQLLDDFSENQTYAYMRTIGYSLFLNIVDMHFHDLEKNFFKRISNNRSFFKSWILGAWGALIKIGV